MNIKSNKGRSILTMLGIIIGISSVIMIISIGNGVKGGVNGMLNDLAGGQIYLYVDENAENAEAVSFTQEDMDAILEKVSHVKGVTPIYSWSGNCEGRKGNFAATISTGTEGMEFQNSDPIIRGKYFSRADYDGGKKVCVLTESGATLLFGTTDVIGLSVDVTIYGVTQEMMIVGIRKDNASSMLSGMMYGGESVNIEMPMSTLESNFGFYVGEYSSLYVIGDAAEYSTQVAQECISLMESRHDVRGQGVFQLQDFNDTVSQMNSILGYITTFVVFVAAISLLVGGIGVMNIMLVSVTERTREIGIRKALGARTASIMLQFLSESAIITLVGGLIGITLGILGAVGVCALMGFTAKVSASTVLIASLFSSGIGLFFGIYPAKKAAKLSPIEALRHE